LRRYPWAKATGTNRERSRHREPSGINHYMKEERRILISSA
jgi:hypothetical protein